MMETKPGIGLAYENVCVSVRVKALVETEEKKVNMNEKQYIEMKRKKRKEKEEKKRREKKGSILHIYVYTKCMYPKKPPFHSNPIPIQKEKQGLGLSRRTRRGQEMR